MTTAPLHEDHSLEGHRVDGHRVDGRSPEAHNLHPLPTGGHAALLRTSEPATLIPLREELIALAAQAFAAPPWREGPADAVRIIDRMWRNMSRPDFVAVLAMDGPHLTGFAYGVTDTVCAGLYAGLTAAPAASALEAFEMVELAVVPAYQGRGIGKALHDSLLSDAPSPRLLLTHPEASARTNYQRWAWTDLGPVRMADGRDLILMRHDGVGHDGIGHDGD